MNDDRPRFTAMSAFWYKNRHLIRKLRLEKNYTIRQISRIAKKPKTQTLYFVNLFCGNVSIPQIWERRRKKMDSDLKEKIQKEILDYEAVVKTYKQDILKAYKDRDTKIAKAIVDLKAENVRNIKSMRESMRVAAMQKRRLQIYLKTQSLNSGDAIK